MEAGSMKTSFIYTLVLSALLTACAAPGRQGTEEARNRLQIAEAMFQERCKGAGEKIYRTVDDVEGIFLMKLRSEQVNFSNQFAMTDPYGDDTGGTGYVENFLRGRGSSGSLTSKGIAKNGYQYVEVIDQNDGIRYRYTGSVKAVGKKDATAPNVKLDLKRDPNFDLNIYAFVLDRTPAAGPMPRYGVTYDDISTREEREYWIAGSSLKIIDLQTNEVIAERIGYMMDRGLGNTSGGRSPWLLARYHACPRFPTGGGRPVQIHQTRNFVEKVLHIKQGN
jgi:hypothetical protein